MTAAQELALVPPKETALQVFQQPNGLDPWLKQIRDEIDAFVPDVSTRKGREAIASIAHRVARSKTALDSVGKELVAELKEIPKKIDAERKRMRDTLDAWRDEVRAPLNEWEAAEEARKAKHQGAIEQINLRLECRDLDSTELRQNIEWLEAMTIDESWEEFEPEALRAKDKALAALRDALAARQKYEAEQAELEELRRKQAEQEQREREAAIAREAEERARREAEQRAQQEREAAARRELELKLQAEQAEREKLEAQQRAEQAARDAEARAQAAAEAERQRIADEQAEIERQRAAREADIAHKTAVLTGIKEAFMQAGITEDQAKAIVNMIRKGEVPSVSIQY